MKRLNTLLILSMFAVVGMYAQVDKATVTTQAEAAKTAAADLKKIDTGDQAWKYDGVIGLNAAATGLMNWTAGGKNNVNALAYAKLHLLYHKNAVAWETNFDTDFGMTWIDKDEDAFQKSSDKIKLATKFGWEFKENWYLTVLAGFQSQYALGRKYQSGYNPAVSKWLAPSYTDISVGIDWKKTVSGCDFSVYLSPVAGRLTTAYVGDHWNKMVTRDAFLGDLSSAIDNAKTDAEYEAAVSAYEKAAKLYDTDPELFKAEQEAHTDFASQMKDKYNVSYYDKDGIKQYDRNLRAEFGFSFKGAIAYKYENLTLGTSLTLFTPYNGRGTELASYIEGSTDPDTYFRYSNKNRQFGLFDVDWDMSISYQFLKVLNVTLQTNLKYYPGTLVEDKKTGDFKERVQMMSVIGLGIGYSF